MWPQKNLKILVPRTPPDPPLPPLTPPRGPGGPKMAKMHSLKSIDDNLCQKSHFWGVKKIDLFFHSECTRGDFPLNSHSLPQQGGLVDEVEHGVEGHFPLEALQGLQLCQVATLDLEMWE